MSSEIEIAKLKARILDLQDRAGRDDAKTIMDTIRSTLNGFAPAYDTGVDGLNDLRSELWNALMSSPDWRQKNGRDHGYKSPEDDMRRELASLRKDKARLLYLVKHCWTHSGYANCGYQQMDTSTKQLYDAISEMDSDKICDDHHRLLREDAAMQQEDGDE